MSWFMLTDVRKPKPRPAGKRYKDTAGVVCEVREWGRYAESGRKRWTTFQVFPDGTANPMEGNNLVRPSFKSAQRALDEKARLGGWVEVER